ncbi:uncharacterized protein B0I36DRAFT_112431 [Microdochium trichocladiopsis]|uniref:Zn(2)-C6 fungal-type domain-containing protein n=1 Tax=Microdochium trichocladiopsis TaxID=1682393 RepID=A0A9P9BQ65_9PEZI|nr:uncharacterized protein B0I36DRAFT_112431 [Microdochium trichocladiopsis]KAH7030617.1 hypothetical protein B0I36DRAFT_112431 [Microdochium trichocladiopsis]
MARKGQPKVRTGCFTCKIRRLKCDEARPFCDRCIRAGRTCAGYAVSVSQAALPSPPALAVQPRQLLAGSKHPLESRALHYFRIHAPYLVGGLDAYFWTDLSLQFSCFEPAVRHSLVAISSLYEQLAAGPQTPASLRHNDFALTHYNAAIQELKQSSNQPLVIFVCMLFICIEFMQANAEAAVRHCRHGLRLLCDLGTIHPWMRDRICPSFHRLSMVPLVFDGLGTADVPSLPYADTILLSDSAFSSMTDARTSLDIILGRILRLTHKAARDRNRRPHAPAESGDLEDLAATTTTTPELTAERHEVEDLLARWQRAYATFDLDVNQYAQTVFKRYKMSHRVMHQVLRHGLQVRLALCRVLVATCLGSSGGTDDDDDDCYDAHLETLASMATLAMEMLTAGSSESHQIQVRRPLHFAFETGMALPMFFVVTKCRELSVRRPALTCLKWLTVQRESLWHLASAVAVAKRVVEWEHGVVLDGEFRECGPGPAQYPGLAPGSRRIRTHWLDLVQLHLRDGVETLDAEVLFGTPPASTSASAPEAKPDSKVGSHGS